jgi:hypothetical protein
MYKFILVSIIAFAVSNLLVTAYRKSLQKIFSKKIYRIVVPVAFSILTIAVYVSKGNTDSEFEPELSEKITTAPKMGLHSAVIEGNLEVVEQHIRAGTDLDIKENSGGSSPLISAALFGKTEIARALIQAGASVNFQNKEGSTPLITAAFFCRTEIVEALLANGADKTIKNNAGSTAIETVTVPFEDVVGIYEYFGETLSPLGLKLDYTYIKETRPKIAEMLK